MLRYEIFDFYSARTDRRDFLREDSWEIYLLFHLKPVRGELVEPFERTQ